MWMYCAVRSVVQNTHEPGPLVQLNRNRKLALADVCVSAGFIEFRRSPAIAADRQFAETDIDAIRINFCAGITDRRGKPSPVRITARPGGLHQWRVSNGLGNAQRIGIVCRTFDTQFNHMRSALAVGHHLAGQRCANLFQRCGERCIARSDLHAARAGSKQQHGVVGRSVAVH